MSKGFVWFHNGSEQPQKTVKFYEELLGWAKVAGPPGMEMLGDGKAPFAGVAERGDGVPGWVPYVEVDDLVAATRRATGLGAEVVQQRRKGPAGEFTIIRDPGGAAVALWQKA